MSIQSTYTDWKSVAGYPAAGVGDLDDLKLDIITGAYGSWFAYIRPGWFYSNGLEQYSYVSKQTISATVSAVSGLISAPISYHPTWGPVFVSEGSLVYTEHHNCFQPGLVPSWSRVGTSNTFVTNVPTGQVVLGVRDLTNIPLALQLVR